MFQDTFNLFLNRFNWVDLIFLVLIIYFIVTNKGFIDAFYEVISFIIALFASYKTYPFLGEFIHIKFLLPQGISNTLGFFAAWFITEIITYIFYILFFYHIFEKVRQQAFNKYLGYIVGLFHFFLFFLFLISFIFVLPIKAQIKKDIINSTSGHYFVNLSHNLEKKLNTVFNQAVLETINFLTIKPESNETVSLGFSAKESEMTIDSQSENIMLNLLNQERYKYRLQTLAVDNNLREVAQSYAKNMLKVGFFSHVSKTDGSTPADRARRDNIIFVVIGENLAYAPDVYIAHQGLMNSPGHRANILSPDYTRIGIGVVDAGIYGKMFVQEFAN